MNRGQRSGRRLFLYLAFCLALCPGASAGGQAPRGVPLPPVGLRWPAGLPSRDTQAVILTRFGAFRLPIGYLNRPGTLPSVRVIGDRASDLPTYDVGGLAFHYTMPDGRQNLADEHFIPGDDGGDRIGIDPARYAVWFTRMRAPERGSRSPDRMILYLNTPQRQLELVWPDSLNNQDYYKGWVEVPATQDRVGIEISCLPPPSQTRPGICQGGMYLQDFGFELEFLLQMDRLQNVFDVAVMTSELLNRWKHAASHSDGVFA